MMYIEFRAEYIYIYIDNKIPTELKICVYAPPTKIYVSKKGDFLLGTHLYLSLTFVLNCVFLL